MDSPPTDRAKSAEIAAAGEVGDILDAIARASAESISGLKTAIATESLRRAATMLGRADSIRVAGLGDAFAVAVLLATGLTERGRQCGVLGPDGAAAQRPLAEEHGRDGLLIVIELPAGRLPGDIIDAFRGRGIPILAIGEPASGPAEEYSDLRVRAPSARIIHGMPLLAGQITAVQLLLIALDQLRAASD